MTRHFVSCRVHSITWREQLVRATTDPQQYSRILRQVFWARRLQISLVWPQPKTHQHNHVSPLSLTKQQIRLTAWWLYWTQLFIADLRIGGLYPTSLTSFVIKNWPTEPGSCHPIIYHKKTIPLNSMTTPIQMSVCPWHPDAIMRCDPPGRYQNASGNAVAAVLESRWDVDRRTYT